MENCFYWESIPTGKENAVTYEYLIAIWNTDRRSVRAMLQKLAQQDNGDGMILIRSSHGKGFYKTDIPEEISRYRRECINKALSNLSGLDKIDRVLNIAI